MNVISNSSLTARAMSSHSFVRNASSSAFGKSGETSLDSGKPEWSWLLNMSFLQQTDSGLKSCSSVQGKSRVTKISCWSVWNIWEFAVNVDLFLADNMSSLSRGRQLMCLDLHDAIYLKDNTEQANVLEEQQNSAETAHLRNRLSEDGIQVKWNRFPHVSRSTHDLIEMLMLLVPETELSSSTSDLGSARFTFPSASCTCRCYRNSTATPWTNCRSTRPFLS